MASPLRRPTPTAQRTREAEFDLLDTGDPVPAGRPARLRVAGTAEMVTDDEHPDFAVLPRYRRR